MVALAKRFEAIVHRPWKRLHAGGIQCGWARRRRYLRRSRSLRGCLDHEGSTAGEERREHTVLGMYRDVRLGFRSLWGVCEKWVPPNELNRGTVSCLPRRIDASGWYVITPNLSEWLA